MSHQFFCSLGKPLKSDDGQKYPEINHSKRAKINGNGWEPSAYNKSYKQPSHFSFMDDQDISLGYDSRLTPYTSNAIRMSEKIMKLWGADMSLPNGVLFEPIDQSCANFECRAAAIPMTTKVRWEPSSKIERIRGNRTVPKRNPVVLPTNRQIENRSVPAAKAEVAMTQNLFRDSRHWTSGAFLKDSLRNSNT